MKYATLGHLLAQYVRQRGLVAKKEQYQKSLWQDTEVQLQKFIQHLKDDGMEDVYSVHCNHYAWQHPDYPTHITLVVKSMGDRIICTLITKALYFLNGWSTGAGMAMDDDSGVNKDFRTFIRCTIVHMFMNLLHESACASTWGTFYAWYAMAQMRDEAPMGENLIHTKQCTQNFDVHLQVAGWSMQEAVKEWLKSHADIKRKLNRDSFVKHCGLEVPQTKGRKHDGTAHLDAHTLQKIQDIGGHLQKEMSQAFRKIKKEWKAGATSEGVSNVETSPEPESEDEDAEEEDANGKNSTNTTQTEKTSTDNTANTPSAPSVPPGPKGRSEDSKAGQPQAPASPPAPGEEGTQPVTGAARPKGPHEQSGEAQCQASLRPAAASSGGIVISTACTSDADLGGGKKVNAAIAHGDAPVDGGTDDPPPKLDPPKPKADLNGDGQAGSSGNNSNGGVPSFDLDNIFPNNIRIARTIIELHLEVLNECEATDWEDVKDDYLQILVEEFMGGNNGHSGSPDTAIPNEASSGNHVSSPVDPPTESDGKHPSAANDDDPWSCMETIPLATDPCPDDDPDPWSCMETIQLDSEQSRANSNHREANSAPTWHTKWIPWIDRNKHMLRECTTQPWFHALKCGWTQYYQQHSATDDNGQRAFVAAATPPMNKLRLWKQWVAQQHRQMRMYSEEEWFPHLLNTVAEETVPDKGEVPGVEKDLEVEQVLAAEDILRLSDVRRPQPLHTQPYMKKPLTAHTWTLILALVIEQCELESRLHEKELYVDDLLEKL
ncbi:hypothetical protein AK88_05179 [Plasmodium fragile]|uniref:Schizont-infected cell agglutination C-terminal domain-containing protein n=1 Tax=Plasmodium fragile TaxID=5857 RepID=A0A0D9QDQ9_PLAFR|nr:uncharacterized protein AK88_05179 [Plasmodium fragile]KJP85185.1 hypothetical protein AK88_05179 [Plasmodium fragile]